MKSWLLKFKISNALNRRKDLPPELQRAAARREDVQRFAENARALDRSLSNQSPETEPPPSLHAGIMGAVRDGARARETAPVWRWRVTAWAGVAGVVTAGILVAAHFLTPASVPPPRQPQVVALAAVDSLVQSGGSIVRDAPAGAVAPLQDELDRVDHDLQRAGEFLSASLP